MKFGSSFSQTAEIFVSCFSLAVVSNVLCLFEGHSGKLTFMATNVPNLAFGWTFLSPRR